MCIKKRAQLSPTCLPGQGGLPSGMRPIGNEAGVAVNPSFFERRGALLFHCHNGATDPIGPAFEFSACAPWHPPEALKRRKNYMTSRRMLTTFDGKFHLSTGSHASIEDGMCAMELVAFFDGASHSDRPLCTSEAIGDFVRYINDHMPDDVRQRLLPYLPRLIGTASADYEQERIEYFAWQTIRVFTPAALRAQGCGGGRNKVGAGGMFLSSNAGKRDDPGAVQQEASNDAGRSRRPPRIPCSEFSSIFQSQPRRPFPLF